MVPNHQTDYYSHMSDSQNPINSIINNYQPSLTIISMINLNRIVTVLTIIKDD